MLEHSQDPRLGNASEWTSVEKQQDDGMESFEQDWHRICVLRVEPDQALESQSTQEYKPVDPTQK